MPRYILGSYSGHCCFVCTILSMLTVCLPVCLSYPAFRVTSLLFLGVTRACSVKNSLLLALLPGLPKDSLQGAETLGLRHIDCSSVSPPSSSCGFQGVPPDVPQWLRGPTRLIKSPMGTNCCLWGHALLQVSSFAWQLNAPKPPC